MSKCGAVTVWIPVATGCRTGSKRSGLEESAQTVARIQTPGPGPACEFGAVRHAASRVSPSGGASVRGEGPGRLRAGGHVIRGRGNVDEAFTTADKALEAEYFVPYFIHTPMEPPAALVDANVRPVRIITATPADRPGHGRATRISRLFHGPGVRAWRFDGHVRDLAGIAVLRLSFPGLSLYTPRWLR